jgi:hypothetical protein
VSDWPSPAICSDQQGVDRLRDPPTGQVAHGTGGDVPVDSFNHIVARQRQRQPLRTRRHKQLQVREER